MKLLVVGAGGQLGAAAASQLAVLHEVVALTRADMDVSSPSAVRAAVRAAAPDAIINCAAYTNVDGAEAEPMAALSANAWAVRALARAAVESNAALVHYSTDFVFDGTTDRPYTENDDPNPRGTYGLSKLLGEWLAADAPRHYVLRVESLFGGRRSKSSIDRIRDQIRAGTDVRAFVDRTVSPSYVDDVVAATARLLEKGAPSGLYHCVNSGWTTWVGIARELARLLDKPDAPITEVPMAAAKLPVERPKFAALSNAKLESVGVTMPTWERALQRYVAAGVK
jgi:dTDP-4-dehydrorhamnose reductase